MHGQLLRLHGAATITTFALPKGQIPCYAVLAGSFYSLHDQCSCLQVDAQITHIQSAQEQRLNSMPPSARQAYNDLIAEQASLLAEAGRFEEEGAELSSALAAAEGELNRNGFKQRVLEVQVGTPMHCTAVC